MKELVKQNGIVRVLIFLMSMTVSLISVVCYGFIVIEGYGNGWLKLSAIGSFLALCWIFFGVSSKDFFGEGRNAELQEKHILMMIAWPLALVIGNPNETERFCLLAAIMVWSVFLVHQLKKKNRNKSSYWKYEIVGKDFSPGKVIEAIRKEFFLVKTEEKEKLLIIKGVGLFAFKVTVNIQSTNTQIFVEPMPTAWTFFFFLKVIPGPALGEHYGKQILKNLGLSLEEPKAEM